MKKVAVLLAAPLLLASCTMMQKPKTIADIVATDDNFSTLRAALNAAGLTDTLRTAGPFTVLAPTNAAFAKLPAGTVETLLKPENRQTLTNVLLYHVLSGSVPASTVVTLGGKTSPTLLSGQTIGVSVNGGMVMINNANVTKTDIMASNGVIHVIDTVLLPK